MNNVPSTRNATLTAAQRKWFTATHWSIVLAAGRAPSADTQAALEKLCRAYWYPLYAYVRRQGYAPHDAQDLTQGFFGELLVKEFLVGVAPEKGKFRSFLLAALNHFLGHERGRARAAKRGGGRVVISLDEQTAEQRYALEPATSMTPERAFEKRWAITVLEQAFGRVRTEMAEEGKGELFEQLQTFLADGAGSGDYSAVAAGLGMSPNAVAVWVHRLRQRYRRAVRAVIAHTVARPEEIEEEMRHLLQALVQ